MHTLQPGTFSRVTRLILATSLAAIGPSLLNPAPACAASPVGLVAAGAVGQAYGSIKGKLVWGGEKAPERRVLEAVGKAAKDPAVCASTAPVLDSELIVDPKTKGVRNAIVYVTKPVGSNPEAVKALLAKAPKVEIDQKNCEYLPAVTLLHEDQAVLFKSSDAVNHNVHYNSFDSTFNVILAANGMLEKKLTAERRPVPLTCDIHPWMKAYVMPFNHPFFAVTGEDGSFEIKGVPAGAQKIVIWQGAIGYVNKERAQGMPVEVPAAGAVDIGEIKLDPARVRKLGG
jgi:hypothetical protein